MSRELNVYTATGNTLTNERRSFYRIQGKGVLKEFYFDSFTKDTIVYFVLDDVVIKISVISSSTTLKCPLIYTSKIYATIDTPASMTNTMFGYVKNSNYSSGKKDELFWISTNTSEVPQAQFIRNFNPSNTTGIRLVPDNDTTKFILPEPLKFEKNFRFLVENKSTTATAYTATFIFDFDNYITGTSN